MDHDEEMEPMHGMPGTLDAELEVQRTIKRAELTAFVCLFRKAIGPTVVHVDSKRIIDGLRKGDMSCIGPDVLSFALVSPESFPVESTRVLILVSTV